ncbi:MAG: DUF1015 domain-containing protein [Actinomycetia bacterium]|nr:DUF1015 domain-containing protein [Actinomycetes bacterium]
MAPFRAWRYSPAAGEPSQLIAPPYDVIGPDLRSQLYARSRYNVVRVDLGMTTPSDNDCDNQYTRAAAQLADWKKSGILVRDPRPTMTFVEESFTGPDGRAGTRHGFLAVIRLYDFDEGVVFPHEYTLSGPKEDRYRLLTATAMSLSPVFLLYDLPTDEITAASKTALANRPPAVTVTDDRGTVTSLWPTEDPDLLDLVGQDLATSRFIIADGHHRYETALRYQKHRREAARKAAPGDAGPDETRSGDAGPDETRSGDAGPGDASYDYALAYLSNMADPGLAVYGTHRLVTGLDAQAVASLPRTLAGTFSVERLSAGATGSEAHAAITTYLHEHPRGAFGLWGHVLDGAYGLELVDCEAVREAGPGHSPAYQQLDVTILQALILERTLGITPADMAAERYVAFFNDPSEAIHRLEAGEFQAGFFLNPTGLDQIRRVAFGGERMPQKATFFYPKLPTGLVFHDLSGRL